MSSEISVQSVYELVFDERAWKEWKKLDATIRNQLKKKLQERLIHPHVASARLTGLENAYKIKLRSLGYRLVYTVTDAELVVEVVSVGKRDGSEVYQVASQRLGDE